MSCYMFLNVNSFCINVVYWRCEMKLKYKIKNVITFRRYFPQNSIVTPTRLKKLNIEKFSNIIITITRTS